MVKNNDKDKYKKYFEILELSEDASLTDIKRSHQKLLELYSSVSIATHPLEEEFGEKEKQEILNQIEEAYQILLRCLVENDRIKKDKLEDTVVENDIPEEEVIKAKDIEVINLETDGVKKEKKEPAPAKPVEPPKDLLNSAAVKGGTLKKIREKLGIGVHEIAVSTKISYKILVNIELERFEKLPEAGYLRWHVMSYAKALSLDPKKIANEYMKRYRRWKSKQEDSGQ